MVLGLDCYTLVEKGWSIFGHSRMPTMGNTRHKKVLPLNFLSPCCLKNCEVFFIYNILQIFTSILQLRFFSKEIGNKYWLQVRHYALWTCLWNTDSHILAPKCTKLWLKYCWLRIWSPIWNWFGLWWENCFQSERLQKLLLVTYLVILIC